MGSCISSNKVEDTINKLEKLDNVTKIKNKPRNTRLKRVLTPPKSEYKKKSIPKTVKRMVWDKYIGPSKGTAKCLCCNHQEIRQIEFHCGHVIAEVNGGQTNVDNLRPICAQCNLSMGSMNLYDFKNSYMK